MKLVLIYLFLINAVGFLVMLIDKKNARKKRWRIPEDVLIGIAVAGSKGEYHAKHKHCTKENERCFSESLHIFPPYKRKMRIFHLKYSIIVCIFQVLSFNF